MSLRVCAQPGCPALQAETRCLEHRREREQQRGSRQARGYGAMHRRERKQWERRMRAGEQVVCWRCEEEQGVIHLVDPDRFDLGHDDHDRSITRGPECQAGNRATATRRISPDA